METVGGPEVDSTMNTMPNLSAPCCSHTNCLHPSEVSLENKSFCREHFIAACYHRLDETAEHIKQRNLKRSALESLRSFLAECLKQVASEALRPAQFDNEDRSKLLHLLLYATELINQLRRSERIARLLPVRLISDPHSVTWVEDTVTQDLSRHGAMLRCTRPYENGQTLQVVRLDTGHKAMARVVWAERDKFTQHKVAVEILNSSNFWNWREQQGVRP
jgi:PilZ domain